MPQDFIIDTRSIAEMLEEEFGQPAFQTFCGEMSTDFFDGSQQRLPEFKGMVNRAMQSSPEQQEMAKRARELTTTKRLSLP